MEDILLLDTDVLIDYLRNRIEAVNYLENLIEIPLVSSVTVAELYSEFVKIKSEKFWTSSLKT